MVADQNPLTRHKRTHLQSKQMVTALIVICTLILNLDLTLELVVGPVNVKVSRF